MSVAAPTNRAASPTPATPRSDEQQPERVGERGSERRRRRRAAAPPTITDAPTEAFDEAADHRAGDRSPPRRTTARLSPTPSSPPPSSSSMNVGMIGTSIPTYTKNAGGRHGDGHERLRDQAGRRHAAAMLEAAPVANRRPMRSVATEVTRDPARSAVSDVTVVDGRAIALHVDLDGQRLLDGRADDDAADRRDVAVVAAPRHRDVAVRRQVVVRRVEVDPALLGHPHRAPGVRRVGADAAAARRAAGRSRCSR